MMLQLIWRPSSLVIKTIYEKYLLQTFDAIKICDIASSDETEQSLFCSRTVKALELIKKFDKKRYRRVQKHLVYIVNCHTLMSGAYNHWLQSCEVNISIFDFEGDEELGTMTLACTFIHEATHGIMHTRSIPYDKKHRLRVEQICHQEEIRFARRVMPEVDLGEFDEKGYQAYFQTSKWRYMVKSLRYIYETNRSNGIRTTE